MAAIERRWIHGYMCQLAETNFFDCNFSLMLQNAFLVPSQFLPLLCLCLCHTAFFGWLTVHLVWFAFPSCNAKIWKVHETITNCWHRVRMALKLFFSYKPKTQYLPRSNRKQSSKSTKTRFLENCYIQSSCLKQYRLMLRKPKTKNLSRKPKVYIN